MDARGDAPQLAAVILAAGQGTRLFGPTGGSKALFRYDGRNLIDYVLVSLKAAGISDIAIIVRHDDEQLRSSYSSYPQLPATGSGTLGAVADAARYAIDRNSDAVITSCDLVCDTEAVNNLLRGHRDKPAWEVTFGVTPVANDAAPIWVRRCDDGVITDYGKDIAPTGCAFASIRVARLTFMRRILEIIARGHPAVSTDTTLMRQLIVEERVCAGAVDIGNAIDIDDSQDILLASGMARPLLKDRM